MLRHFDAKPKGQGVDEDGENGITGLRQQQQQQNVKDKRGSWYEAKGGGHCNLILMQLRLVCVCVFICVCGPPLLLLWQSSSSALLQVQLI